MADDAILLSYDAGSHLHRYGGRVFEDGRYELFSTTDQVSEPDWTAYEPFTPEQMRKLRAAVDDVLAAGLPDRVKPNGPPRPDGDSARFVLRDRVLAVDDFSGSSPAEIDRLLERIAELRRRAPVPSTWRLWSRGAVVELEARCDIGEVPVLRRLRDVIFMATARPRSGDPAPSAPDPPAGTPLLSLTFATPKGDEVLEVHADGRRIDRPPGAGERVSALDDDRMGAIRQALEEIDWAAQPSRLC